MRKSIVLTSLILVTSFLSGCGGSNSGGGATIDKNTKTAFLSCKEKVDVVKNSISELTMEESGEYVESTRSLRLNQKFFNVLPKERYLSLQNFGLYILNNVYHCVTFGYDSEKVPLETVIYDEVDNELDANLRNYLQSNNLTTKFYMQIEKGESDYTFKVDWLGKESLRGGIYVGGKIEMNGNDVSKFTVNSFTQDESCYAFTAHYDFVENNFYMLCFSCDRDAGLDLLNETYTVISKLNGGQLEYADVENIDYSNIYLSSGKITKNIDQINYQGYVRSNYNETVAESSAFVSLFNAVKNKFTAAKFRTSNDKLNYSSVRRVHYMNEALKYGLDSTKLYVTDSGGAIFPFVGVNEFTKMCDGVPSAYKEIFARAKAKLLSKNSSASLFFEDEEMRITNEPKNERYYSLNTYTVDSVNCSITDKVKDETLLFAIKGDQIINIKSTNLDYIPDDDPTYEVTIKFMTGFGHNVNNQLQENVINPFNQQYSGKYKIQLETTGSIQVVINTIEARAEGGVVDEIPEFLISKADALETLVKNDATRKYLYNFDSFFEKSGLGFTEEEYAKFDEVLLNDGTSYSEEGRWGLPFDTSDQYMFYDKSLFTGDNKQYDLPTTFEELVNVAQRIRNDKSDINYIPVAFTDTKNILLDIFLQNDIPVLTDKDNPFEFTDAQHQAKILQILTTFDNCLEQKLFSSKDMTSEYVNELFNEGRCAIGFMQSDAIKYLHSKEDIGVMKVPFANGKQVYARGGCVSSISLLKTGNPYATKGAWLFIKELLSKFVVNYSLTNYYTPALKYEVSGMQLDNLGRDVATFQNEIRDKYVNIVKVKNINQIYSVLDNVFSSLSSREQTPEQVYNNLISVALD